MIYEVYLDDNVMYYPGDDIYTLTEAVLEQNLGEAGTLEITIPVTNPCYGMIQERISMVQVLKDGQEIFYGEVRETEEELTGLKHVTAIGELAFLYDSIQPQGRFQNTTPEVFFQHLVSVHNSKVETKKRFQAGIVTIVDSNDSIYRFTNHEDTLTAMRNKLCDSRLNGYLRVRKENGIRYLDCVRLEDYGKRCNQPIAFGENLLSYSKNVSGQDIATALVPLGAMLDESPIEGLYAYTDIKSINNGQEFISLPEAVERFGWIEATQTWDSVKIPANLLAKGYEWLRSKQFEKLVIELEAVDLSMLDADIDSCNVGDFVQLQTNWDTDIWLPLQQKVQNLLDPASDRITLGYTTPVRYTDQTKELADLYSQRLEDLQNTAGVARNAFNTATGAAEAAVQAQTTADNTANTVQVRLAVLPDEYVTLSSFEIYQADTTAALAACARTTDLPTVPQNVSAFANDAGYLTAHQDLSGYAQLTDIPLTALEYQDILDRLAALEDAEEGGEN